MVHGGVQFREAVRIDSNVVEALRRLTDLAPLHQPKSLDALDAVTRVLPEAPSVACFDTAFHATLPPAARTYALPRGLHARRELRRLVIERLRALCATDAEFRDELRDLLGSSAGATRR